MRGEERKKIIKKERWQGLIQIKEETRTVKINAGKKNKREKGFEKRDERRSERKQRKRRKREKTRRKEERHRRKVVNGKAKRKEFGREGA